VDIPYERQRRLPVAYRNQVVGDYIAGSQGDRGIEGRPSLEHKRRIV
jgi:hypothetical protein